MNAQELPSGSPAEESTAAADPTEHERQMEIARRIMDKYQDALAELAT